MRYISQSVTTLVASLALALSAQSASAQEQDEATEDEVIDEIRVFGDRVTGDPAFGYSMDIETLDRIPGTQDDPIKAIITLPGVLTNNDFDTGVALRGTRPDDNRYYLDFLPTGSKLLDDEIRWDEGIGPLFRGLESLPVRFG